LSHFSRDPKVVSHFSRGPKSSPAVRTRPAESKVRAGATAPATTPPRVAADEESPSARRFGEVLLDEKLITVAQLEAALRLQAVSRTYVPIGQVLLASKILTRKQLNTLLHRHKKRSRLGDILVRAGRITPDQLHTALNHHRHSSMPLGQALVQLGYVTDMMMRDALCTQLHVNFFDLDPITIDPALTKLISERFAARHLIIPLFRVGDILVVAMDDPSQAELIEKLQAGLGVHIEIVMTTPDKLKTAMKRLYGPPQAPHVDVFRQRNILIGPIRDHVVAELVAKGLSGVIVAPLSWQ
jgi:type II secretion system (T2SS) protein E